MYFNGLKLSGALESFLSHHNFWVQKCKKKLFEENVHFFFGGGGGGGGRYFYQIEVQVITNPCSQLEKTPNTLIFACDRFFMFLF